MSISQPAKPALDIRSLATPKPPRGFLSQVPTHLATPLISSHNLPSPPFTPIVPIIMPSNTHHTQPLHSTPLYEDDKNIVCEVSDIINESESRERSNAKHPVEVECKAVEQGEVDSDDDSIDSLPSPGYVPIYDNTCQQSGILLSKNENKNNMKTKNVNTSPPSPGYIPLHTKQHLQDNTDNFDEANKDENNEIVDQQNKVESMFDLSLDSLVSDYPDYGGGNRNEDEIICQKGREVAQVQSAYVSNQGLGNNTSMGCTPWVRETSLAHSASLMSRPLVDTDAPPTGWTTSSPLSRLSPPTGWTTSSPLNNLSPRTNNWKTRTVTGIADAESSVSGYDYQEGRLYQRVHQLDVSSSSQLRRGTSTNQRAKTGWSTSSNSTENRTAAHLPSQLSTAWISSTQACKGSTSERNDGTDLSCVKETAEANHGIAVNRFSHTVDCVSNNRVHRGGSGDLGGDLGAKNSVSLSQRVSQLGKTKSLFSPSLSPALSPLPTSNDHEQSRKSTTGLKESMLAKEEERFLSICFAGGSLGAALFDSYTGKLELLKDIPDMPPDYEMLTSLVYQTEPHIILASARQEQSLLESLKHLCRNSEVSTSAFSDDTEGGNTFRKSTCLVMRPGLEFSLSSCTRRVKMLEVPGEESSCEQEQLIKLSAYVDFTAKSMIRSAGALLKYLDKNYRTGMDQETPMVLFISSLVLDQILSLDESAFTALQVFSASCQLSGSKAGSWNRKREGLSMFNILNRCGSVVGSRFMRRMLRCPSANLEVIIHRQQAIAFFTSSGNLEFVQALIASIRQIKNFHRIVNKLVSNTMMVTDWQALYRTLSGLVQIAQLSQNCKMDVPILNTVNSKVCDNVYSLRSIVEQVIDFQASLDSGNLSVKPGVDRELDEKRRLHNALPDLLNVVAQEESKNLPPYMQVCTVCYLPQVGYLIAIPYQKDLEDQGVDFRNIPQLEFVFESNGAMHYRNGRTLALDQTMGDVVQDITRLEMGILSRLTEAVIRNRTSMEEAVGLCGQLDCLLALAMVSKENNWTRPDITEGGHLAITDGRHPLQELTVPNFIPNDCCLGGDGGRVHLLTGPNSSGKSVFMKQVGLIVYLAHLGCWVPAEKALIPVTDRILTRIHTVESISLGMSSFLCDINQLSTALTSSSNRSLLLVDEFGKGTTPVDGAALLAATILGLLNQGHSSPLCILSSHFHVLPTLLGSHPALRYFHLETQTTTMGLVYLYKVVVGVSTNSHARCVALKAGIQEILVARADQVLEDMVKGLPASLPTNILNLENFHQFVSCFLDVDLRTEDEIDIFLQKALEFVV